jgi:hypothetical protein
MQVYLDARAADDNSFRVLLFRSPPGRQQQLNADGEAEDDNGENDDDDDTCSSSSSRPGGASFSGGVLLLGGSGADERVRCAAPRALRALPPGAVAGAGAADAGAAALRQRFGQHYLVAYSAEPLRGALAAQPRSCVRMTWRGTHFLLWQAAAADSASSLASRLASARGARLLALAAALILAAAYRSLCAQPGGGAAPGVCRAARQLLAPLASLFLALSLMDSPLGRAARAALARLRPRQHAE